MDNEKLLESLRIAVAQSPEDAALRLHLGRMLLLSGHRAEALEHALEAARLAPGEMEAQELLVDARGSQDPVEAVPPDEAVEQLDEPPHMPGYTRDLVTLADVAGLESVKQRLQTEFLAPARNPGLAARYGKDARGGLLLYGPPGCGKTYIARALAGELGASFMPIDSSTVVSSRPGEPARQLANLFDTARRNRPSLLFFDEADAIALGRNRLGDAGWLRGMINQLLTELDGFASNAGVFVVAATNAPWDIDTAMLRPGRFDRVIAVLPPDAEARSSIFSSHLRGRLVGSVDVERLGRESDGFSGADIAHVVEEAASMAFTRAMAEGSDVLIDQGMLIRAVRDTRPSIRAWLEQARNYVEFANRDGLLDDLAAYMRERGLLR